MTDIPTQGVTSVALSKLFGNRVKPTSEYTSYVKARRPEEGRLLLLKSRFILMPITASTLSLWSTSYTQDAGENQTEGHEVCLKWCLNWEAVEGVLKPNRILEMIILNRLLAHSWISAVLLTCNWSHVSFVRFNQSFILDSIHKYEIQWTVQLIWFTF